MRSFLQTHSPLPFLEYPVIGACAGELCYGGYVKHFSKLCVWLMLGLCLAACVRQPDIQSLRSKIEVTQSRTVRLSANAEIKPVVAVVVRDNAKVAELRQFMEAALRARGYEVTENPSAAGYILQLNAIHAGSMDPDAARSSVPQGYGFKISGSGQGALVFMVDILVATRTQPKSVKGRPQVITTTATNTRVDDEELRVAALLRVEGVPESQLLPELEKAVVKAVAGVFPAPR